MFCGICLRNDSCTIEIFSEQGIQLEIASLIKRYLWFKNLDSNSHLKKICNSCWQSIASFHVFYTTVEAAHKKFSSHFNLNSNNDGDQRYTKTLSEFITENSCNNENQKPIRVVNKFGEEYNIVEIKSEPPFSSDILQLLSQGKDDNFEGVTYSDDILPEGAEMLIKQETEEVYQQNYDQALSDFIEFENDNLQSTTLNSLNKNATASRKVALLDDKMQNEDELIARFVKLECEKCPIAFSRFQDLAKHYHMVHNISGYARCCDKKLSSRAYILDHINFHINPDIYNCKVCTKAFQSQYSLRTHMNLKHHSTLSAPKIFDCKHCAKKFSNQKDLNEHASEHLSKSNNSLFCVECRKFFPSEVGMQMHYNVFHRKPLGHICHVCGMVIRCKAEFLRHMADHTEKLGSIVVNEPVCRICEKTSTSVKNLRHHIKYVHSPNRPHKCTVCQKGFKLRQKLKDHIATHAVGSKFKCPYCSKRFRSKLHLYSHKYRMHKVQYAQEKLNSTNSSDLYGDKEQTFDDATNLSDGTISPDDFFVLSNSN